MMPLCTWEYTAYDEVKKEPKNKLETTKMEVFDNKG